MARTRSTASVVAAAVLLRWFAYGAVLVFLAGLLSVVVLGVTVAGRAVLRSRRAAGRSAL